MTVTKLACIALLVCALSAGVDAQGRRVRLRPRPVQDDQLQYYEAEPRAGEEELVLVSPAEELIYNRQAAARADNYIRPAVVKPRTKESAKAPPVQTIRNYNKVNDDGSFTFGYEAADGSFKEETRGTDCVVRGKYGYIDPDGNKREFTYVSGNPCDPNAPSEDDDPESLKDESNEASDEPANYPTRTAGFPVRPAANYPVRRPIQTTSRPATTVFQNIYNQNDDDDDTIIATTRKPATPIAITPRPQLPATTFRPQLLSITQRPVTARPQVIYTTPAPQQTVRTTPVAYSSSRAPAGHIDFAAEFAKFQHENQIVSSTPSGFKTKSKVNEPAAGSGNPIYSTQLVYDPSNGVYNTQLFQSLPQGNGEFTLNHKVQPTVTQPQAQPQPHYTLQPQPQPQAYSPPVYRHRLAQPINQQVLRSPQEIYQRQQSELQYQNSQQLYAQQQQLQQSQLQQDRQAARTAALQQQGPQQFQPQQQQQFYYVAPGREQQASPIDAFFRGQGLQF